MTSMQNIGVKYNNQPDVEPKIVKSVPANVRRLNFKSDDNDRFVRTSQPKRTRPAILDSQDSLARAIEEQKKEQKKQKRKQDLSWGLGIGASLVLILALLPQALAMFRRGGASNDGIRTALENEAVKLKIRDVSNKPDRHIDCYSEEVQNFFKHIEGIFNRKDIELKGGKRVAFVQLAGPGGTGKSDGADEIAKRIIKLRPGSEYYVPDLSMLTSSSYRGQDVQMLSEYTDAINKRAIALKEEFEKKGGVKKYVILFLDEYDKIAMQDFSHNKHDSNKTTGALKTLFNTLKEHDNVIVMSATNYPELIEGAVDSRMAEKIVFKHLTPKQIITSITEYYKLFEEKGLIDDALLDANNDKMKQICKIIGKPEHEVEYRKIFDNILPKVIFNSPDMEKMELKHFVEALTETSSARILNLTDPEITALRSIVA